jgi:hypothetical protein
MTDWWPGRILPAAEGRWRGSSSRETCIRSTWRAVRMSVSTRSSPPLLRGVKPSIVRKLTCLLRSFSISTGPSHSSEVIKNSRDLWQSFNRTGIHHHRMRLIEHLADLDDQGATKNYGEGRGIVTIAGNADTLERVLYMLRMLRHGECLSTFLPELFRHRPFRLT